MTVAPPPRLLPMLATPGPLPPDGPDWAFEAKWDGIRALIAIEPGGLRITGRKGDEVTSRYPELGVLAGCLAGRSALVDGELVVFDEDGRPDFQLLQPRIGLTSPERAARAAAVSPATFIAFDLLWADGDDLTGRPYLERRGMLEELGLTGPNRQLPPAAIGEGEAMVAASRRLGLEGVVAKRVTSPYRPGARSRSWVKARNLRRQEFVIGGYRPGRGARSGRVGSLLVGVHDRPPGAGQRLVYAGGVGTGLTEAMLDRLTAELRPLERATSPFDEGDPMAHHGPVGHPKRTPVFCDPVLVCEVEFAEWTREGILRAPSFKGLRDDKRAQEVVRET